jgi:hypothetical protein
MIENDKLIRRTKVYSEERNAPIYKNEVVITKEEFLKCYNEWVIKPKRENPISIPTEFYIPVDNGGGTPV